MDQTYKVRHIIQDYQNVQTILITQDGRMPVKTVLFSPHRMQCIEVLSVMMYCVCTCKYKDNKDDSSLDRRISYTNL